MPAQTLRVALPDGPGERRRWWTTPARAVRSGPAGVLRAIVRRSLFLQRWRYAYYILAYGFWRRMVRVDPWQVAFLSDSRGDVSGNLAFLRAQIARQSPRTRVVAVLRPRLGGVRSLGQALALPRIMAASRVIVLDDFYPLIYQLNLRPGTQLGQVWHAVGAFKRVGHSRAGLPGGPVPGSRIHRNYTWATASSPAVRADVADSFGIDVERVHALGVPRTDALLDPARVAATRAKVRNRLGIGEGVKIALFAPTFRGHGARTAHYDYGAVDWEALAHDLAPGWTLVVKMHPLVRPLTAARPGLRGVVDVTAVREMTDLMMAADVLITDYSSAIFEFALLRRPIVFFVPDLAEYTASRDFYRPFARYLIGPVVTEGSGLAEAILQATVDDAAFAGFLDEFASACDGHSSERIARELILAGGPTDVGRDAEAGGGLVGRGSVGAAGDGGNAAAGVAGPREESGTGEAGR